MPKRSIHEKCTLTRHIVQQPVLIAEHGSRANDCCTRVRLLHKLLALSLRAVERRRGVVRRVEVGNMHEAINTVLRSNGCNCIGTLGVDVVVREVPIGSVPVSGEGQTIRKRKRTYLVSYSRPTRL